MKRFIAVGVALAIWGCPTPSPPSPKQPPDASDAAPAIVDSTIATACANLTALGCIEGRDAGACITVLSAIYNDRLAPLDLVCITHATDRPSTRQCVGIGPLGCP
jgi:hypothetical protein